MSGRSNDEWRGVLDAAAATVDRWWKDAGFWRVSEDVDRRVSTAEGFLRTAYQRLDSMEPSAARDASLRALVDGALAQVEAPPLRWTDPVGETADTVVDAVATTARRASTWGAAGVGAALVLVAVLYVLTRRA